MKIAKRILLIIALVGNAWVLLQYAVTPMYNQFKAAGMNHDQAFRMLIKTPPNIVMLMCMIIAVSLTCLWVYDWLKARFC